MAENATEPSTSAPTLWAFLVGIDEYSGGVRHLRGCVNDVEAMRGFLTDRLSVPATNIRILINEKATREAILQTFNRFLINNPDIQYGDQILFHYSGHGGRMRDQTGIEPDGYNETLVAVNSREPGIYDIPDKTIAALLAQLAANKGRNITVVLDCCHSGSGTREIQEVEIDGQKVALTRRAANDERLPPADLDAAFLSHTMSSTRSTGPSGWAVSHPSYVLLAGCRDDEESNEHQSPEENWYGALTYFMLDYMKTMPTDVTYRDLHEEVAAKVNAHYRQQMPQCEGQRHRVVFGGAEIQREPFITVQDVQGQQIRLAGGLVHGLSAGSEVALYPPETRTHENLPAPLATAIVQRVSATQARAQIIPPLPEEPIPLHARALLTKQAYPNARQTVSLHAAPGEANQKAIEALREAILQATPEKKPSPYLALVDDLRTATLRVRAKDGRLYIYDQKEELLIKPQEIATANQVTGTRQALESIARYQAVLELSNRSFSSKLTGKIKVALHRCSDGFEGIWGFECQAAEEEPLKPDESNGELVVHYYDSPTIDIRNHYVVKVTNQSRLPVYPHIFTMSPDYGIYLLYPTQGQQEAIQASMTLSSGLLLSGGEGIQYYLPGTYPSEEWWESSRDYVKVIVTEKPTDLALLQQAPREVPKRGKTQPSFSSPLEKLVDTIAAGGQDRHNRPTRSSAGEEWATVTVPVTVVRAQQSTKLDAAAGDVRLSDGLTLVKPAGFQGNVTVSSLEQSKRGTAPIQPPPGLAGHPEHFQLLQRAGTRSVGATGVVITFEVDDASRQSITPENPLRLELGSLADESASELLPIIFDGEDYLLAGYGHDGKSVELVTLPEPVSSDEHDEQATRGIGRTLRLFIYKKMGRHTRDIGLRRAELDNKGQVQYGDVNPEQFEAGDQVALFVHGFTSDTSWMIKGPAQFLQQEGLAYDHFLTWDYESFGTSVAENGEKLATALKQQCGFGPNEQITLHVYAHSMGGFLSRCMIERSGGHQFVDRLVLAGAPSNGTTLASSTRGAVFLLSAMLNQWSVVPPVGALGKLLQSFREQGEGMADLEVNSALAQELNALDEPSDVPYLVLAGENVPNPETQSRLNRLAHKILDQSLDTLFGEQNDLVIGLSSLKAVRNGTYPNLTVEVVPSNHFDYFSNRESRAALKRWLEA